MSSLVPVVLASMWHTPPVEPRAQTPVVVATRTLDVGTPITQEDLAVVYLDADAPHVNTIGSIADVVGHRPAERILPYEAIRAERLGWLQVPPGHRALTVLTDDPILAHLEPGNHVDVLLKTEPAHVTTLVMDVEVGRIHASSTDDAVSGALTLFVEPVHAERVALGEQQGVLRFTLGAKRDWHVRRDEPGIHCFPLTLE